MEANIGRFDRYVRLVTGLMALTNGSRMRRAPLARAALLSFGAMKVAEGVTGWCPVVQLGEVVRSKGNAAQGSGSSQPVSSSASTHTHDDRHSHDRRAHVGHSQEHAHDGDTHRPSNEPEAVHVQ